MRVSDMTQGKFLTAEGIKDRPVLLTVDRIKREEMSDGKDKWVMYFLEIKEGWVLNKTNLNLLAEFFGDETDDWERQKVVLFADRVPFGDKMTLGIRCRLPKQQRPAPAPMVHSPRLPGRPAPPMTQDEVDESDPVDEVPF